MKLPFGLKLARKVWKEQRCRKLVTACYIEGGTIILGTNKMRTDPQARHYGHLHDRTHAELNVLKNVKDGSKGKLYIYRERMNQDKEKSFKGYGFARCCPACINLVKSKGIKTIVYTTNDGFAKERIN